MGPQQEGELAPRSASPRAKRKYGPQNTPQQRHAGMEAKREGQPWAATRRNC